MRKQRQVDSGNVADSLMRGKDAGHRDELRLLALLEKFLIGCSETLHQHPYKVRETPPPVRPDTPTRVFRHGRFLSAQLLMKQKY